MRKYGISQRENLNHMVNTQDLKTTGADGKSRADFPICTALSPSAKAIKVPKKYYNHERKPLLEQAGKRLSLDSGYAEGEEQEELEAEADEKQVNINLNLYCLQNFNF